SRSAPRSIFPVSSETSAPVMPMPKSRRATGSRLSQASSSTWSRPASTGLTKMSSARAMCHTIHAIELRSSRGRVRICSSVRPPSVRSAAEALLPPTAAECTAPCWSMNRSRASMSALLGLQPVALLDQLPVGVLVEDLVAAELVDVAALVVEHLAVGAPPGDDPHRHRAVAGDPVVDVVPPHAADHREAVGEDAPDRLLAAHAPAARLRSAGHQEGRVVVEEAHDALDVAGVERRVDLEHQLEGGAGGGGGGHGRSPFRLDTMRGRSGAVKARPAPH